MSFARWWTETRTCGPRISCTRSRPRPSAVRKLLRLRLISRQSAETAVGHLRQLPLTIAGTKDLMARVWQLRDAVTPYDAYYAALAETLEAPFVTGDRRLARALAHGGARAIFLGDLG